jgi:undecaprenyl-diphosphatase
LRAKEGEVISYLVLGLIQGLAEFLPVSSSGHLVLAERLFGLTPPGLMFEACLHLGTVAAILVFFRSDLAAFARTLTPRGDIGRRKEIGLLLLGTVPIVVVGLVLRGSADSWFHSLWVVGVGWMATAGMLLLADRRACPSGAAQPSVVGALAIGVAQSVALVPGVSRSGFTLGAGMLAGVRPERAARFSFLLSIPAVVGAAGLTLWDGVQEHAFADSNVLGILLGTAVAFFVGLVALRAFLSLVARTRLWPFALYCAALSVTALLLAALR